MVIMAAGKAANHAERADRADIPHPDATNIGAPSPSGARTAPKARPGMMTKPVKGSVIILAKRP
jgi:hypothetical protein